MVLAAAVVSLMLLMGGVAVVAAMIMPNRARIVSALVGPEYMVTPARPVARRSVTQPRLIAVRPMLRAAA